MRINDLIRLVYSNLNRMRGRVVMTAMGVVIGTSAIVVLISLSTGLQNNTVGNFSSYGNLNQITVFSGARFGGQSASATTQGLTPDVINQLKQMSGVVAVTPYEQLNGRTTLKLNRLEGFGSIYGIDPLVVPQMAFTMDKGIPLVTRGTVIVGASVSSGFSVPGQGGARRQGFGGARFGGGSAANILGGLLGGGGGGRNGQSNTSTTTTTGPDLYNQTLLLEMTRSSQGEQETHDTRLHVGGVLKPSGGNQDYNVYMSIADVTDLLTWSEGTRPNWNKEGYSQVLVIAEQDPQVTLEVTNNITAEGFFALSTSSTVQSLNSTFQIIQAVLGGIASIALLVAAIGIANTMIMSVLERTREIGLMKAIGARNRDILTVFITEAGTIGLLGGLTGLALGVGLSKVIDVIAVSVLASNAATSGSTAPTSVVAIPLWLPIFAIGFSVIIGLAAGIYPAFRAVQLDPVQALRYE